ncbi:MAG: hypothetical protein AB7O86_05650 [Porticoccaceae bacterium]
MSNKATFETATIADAVAKAVAVAPNKGSALDRSGGIVIELNINPGEPVVIRSTDLEVTYRAAVNVVELTPDPVTWRLPIGLFTKLLAQLPVTPGSQVVLSDTPKGDLLVVAGRTKAKSVMIDPSLPFPQWEAFDETPLIDADSFARRLQQVAWATDGRTPGDPLSGVHISGTHLVATDKKAVAFVPCTVNLPGPVTAPLHTLAVLMKNTEAVGLAATADKLLIVPGQGIQLTSTIIKAPYPKVEMFLGDEHFTSSLTVGRDDFSQALNRMLVLAGEDRKIPAMHLTFADGQITLMMDVPDVGKVQEILDGIGGADEQKIIMNPKTLKRAVDASHCAIVELGYHKTNQRMPFRVKDEDGYFAVLSPFDPSIAN